MTEGKDFFSKIVTGSIIGCLGRADLNGIFHVEDWIYANYAKSAKIPQGVVCNLNRSLFNADALQDPNRRLVALVSGLELGLPQE